MFLSAEIFKFLLYNGFNNSSLEYNNLSYGSSICEPTDFSRRFNDINFNDIQFLFMFLIENIFKLLLYNRFKNSSLECNNLSYRSSICEPTDFGRHYKDINLSL